MTPNEFKQWLDGFLSGCGASLTDAQIKMMKDKLNTVISEPQYKIWYHPYTITQPVIRWDDLGTGVSSNALNNLNNITFGQNTAPIHLVKDDGNIGGVAV